MKVGDPMGKMAILLAERALRCHVSSAHQLDSGRIVAATPDGVFVGGREVSEWRKIKGLNRVKISRAFAEFACSCLGRTDNAPDNSGNNS